MPDVLTLFDPPPLPDELPAIMASPFAAAPPHALARRAAESLQDWLRVRAVPGPTGQMFGVLVVQAADGRVGWLRAFSGMLDGTWLVPGFAPPLFDGAARDAIWPAGQAELRAFAVRHGTLAGAERAALELVRAERSNQLRSQLYDGYLIRNAQAERRSLWSLFAPASPPGGAADCAAPKLFALANAHGLRPLALAELWWGPAGKDSAHQPGVYYPSCHRCRRILPFMLAGLAVAPAPPLPAAAEPRVVWQDDALVVVDKPSDLPSSPDRHDRTQDSVRVWLERRQPAPWRIVSRLDVAASGLLLAAREPEAYDSLQRQLALGEAETRLVALLDGEVGADQGTITQPVGGKRAVTDWRVVERSEAHTRVCLQPRTGRLRQLREHCALGLGAPIVHDGRLLLHAETLTFVHPRTGVRVTLEQPAPF